MKTQKRQAKAKGILLHSCEGVRLLRNGRNSFTVQYGEEITSNLSYGQAAREYGSCIMHALSCEGKLDNPPSQAMEDRL